MFSSLASYFINTVFLSPSMSALFLTGVLFFIIILLLAVNYKQIMDLEYYKKIVLLSVVSVAMGVHGLLHLGAELGYGFNPFQGVVL
jgi:hypothetical protein